MHLSILRTFTALILVFLLAVCSHAVAQTSETHFQGHPGSTTPDEQASVKKDTSAIKRDSTKVTYFYSNFEKLGNLVLTTIDTAIEGFQRYDPLLKNSMFYAQLGNIGQNYRSLTPFPGDSKSGFDYGIHSFDRYTHTNDSVKYYKVFKTYSELSYVQGAKKEQNFHAVFSRNIYRSLNLGFDFRVASSPGAYTRQKTNHINFTLTAQYFSKNKRYGVISNFIVNRLINYENGGITSDSLFTNNVEPTRTIIPVHLNYATNRIKESGFFMKHYFDLKRHSRSVKDTLDKEKSRIDLGRLSYSFEYHRQIQNFTDQAADSNFFPTPVINAASTADSLTIKQFSNTFIWSNPSFKTGMKPRVVQIEAGIRQQYTSVVLYDESNIFRQYMPFASVNFTPFESLVLTGYTDYTLGNYNANDFNLKARLDMTLGSMKHNAGMISFRGKLRLQQPEWFFAHYKSNFYQWDTSWQKQRIISGGASYIFRYFEAGFDITRINNFTYLDTNSLPRQFTSEFGHMRVFLNSNTDIWRFRINSHLLYQLVSGTNVLRLPLFIGDLTVSYVQPLFHRAAIFVPGLSFFYNTSYYADSYNPALRSFYLQDKKNIGNYLYMDFFISLKIQHARFFVTYTHFNAGFMAREYFTTPGYPMQDGAFKFGISWRFHD